MEAFTIFARLFLEKKEFDKGIAEAEKKGISFGDSLSKIGNVTKNVAKVATTAVTAASGAIAKITSSSVKAYSQFQQLEGGIDTLFGTAGRTLQEYQKSLGITEKSTQKAVNESVKNYQKQQKAYDNVMAKAKTAYVRAGVSMNRYMETVTGFSASLIQSLQGDTEAAAEVADRAIVDMSDNANKMGTALESIQNAYQGFAKQNYTMLDNLKLGYGGTKTEMQRLIKDAAAMTDIQERLNVTVDQGSMSFSNIVNAISVMQEHLNIAGTTSKEAATTIEGSLKMVKASWEDLKVSLADPNGDINGAIDNLVSSVGIAAENLVPAISRALKGTGKLIKEIAPVLSEKLPGIIEEVLPDLISGGVTLVSALAKSLVENIPVLLDAAGQVLDAVIQEFGKSDSPILQGVGSALTLVKNALEWIKDHQQETVDAVGAIAGALAGLKIADTVIKGLELLQGVKNFGFGGGGGDGTPTTTTTNPTAPVVPGGSSTPTTDTGWMKPGMFNMGAMTPDFIGDYYKLTDPVRQLEEETAGMTESEKQRYTFVKQLIDGGATPAEAAKEANKLFYGKNPTLEVTTGKTAPKDRSPKVTGNHTTNPIDQQKANKQSLIEGLLDPNSEESKTIDEIINNNAEEYFNPTEKPKPAKTPAKNGMKQVREYQEMQELLDPNSTTSKKLKELTEKGIEVPVKPKEIEKFVEEVEQGAQEKPPQIELKPKENAAQELSDGVGTVDVKTKSVWSTLFQTAQDYFNNNELITKFKGKWSELIEKGKEALSNNPFGLKTVADWIEFFRNGQEQANRTELSVPTDLQPDPNEAEELAAEVGTVTTKTEVEAEEGANSKLARQIGTVHVPVSFVGGAGGGGGGGGGSRNNMTGGYLALHAKGDWDIPFDNYPALLHRNEMVLTASQARRYREGEDGGGFSLAALGQVVAQAVREGMRGVSVNSYLDGRNLTDEIMRIAGSDQAALRYV